MMVRRGPGRVGGPSGSDHGRDQTAVRPLIAIVGATMDRSGARQAGAGISPLRNAEGLGAPVPSDTDCTEAGEWIARADGLLLAGPVDPGPAEPLVKALVRLAVAQELPVLGVAGGAVALNGALGGTAEPRRAPSSAVPSSVALDSASMLARTLNDRPVPPATGMRITELGAGLVASGFTAEGEVAAVERTRSWVLGVPWSLEDPAATSTVEALVAELVNRARRGREPAGRTPIPLTACRAGESVVDPDLASTVDRLVDRVLRRLPEIGAHLLDRYVAEVVDYRALGEKTLREDVLPTAERNVEDLLAAVRAGASIDEERLEGLRRSASRRATQGISLHDLLHAYRLWGRVVWDEILSSARSGVAAERDAVLWLAGRVMNYVDRASSAIAQTYLDDVTGVPVEDGTLRGDLLESLISGQRLDSRSRRQATMARLDPAAAHSVLVVRPAEAGQVRRSRLRQAMLELREALRPSSGTVRFGVREDELVVLYPSAGQPRAADALRKQAEAWADRNAGFLVGIGREHTGFEGIATSYAEAQQAVHTAESDGMSSRVVHFSRVLVDQVLRTSAYSDAVVDEAITPLRAYDEARNAELVRTLRTYFTHGFNLARSAAALHVTPNTVTYRLGRIRDLTGRDPADPDDLLVLVLGLKIVGDAPLREQG